GKPPMPRTLLVFAALWTLLLVLAACGKTEHLQGRNLYLDHCANCHFDEGQGLRQLMPPLAGADYLRDNPAQVVAGIRYGMNGPMEVNGVTYNAEMPGNRELSEFQIVNIMNYINQAWGNDYGLVTVEEVRNWLEE
ncbi:MAG: cytochrome c, partial [Lewinella sp.]